VTRLIRTVTDPVRARGPRRRRLRRGRRARRLRSSPGTKGTLALALLVARIQQAIPPALPRQLAAPLPPALRAAHLLRVPRRGCSLVPLPALRAPFPRTHGETIHVGPAALTRASETPPEAPSPHRPHPCHADARSEGQESARSRPQPQRAQRPRPASSRAGTAQQARRGRRARDLARSEHGGTLRVSMGSPGPRWISCPPPQVDQLLAAADGSVARRRRWISCPPPQMDQSPPPEGWISRRRAWISPPPPEVDQLPAPR
jgi:hypothetical protein